MSGPQKRIKTDADLQAFLGSRQFAELWTYMLRLNEVVKGKKRSAVSKMDASPPVTAICELFEALENWVNDIPPVQQQDRFGNKAFRTWHARLLEEGPALLSKVIDTSKHNLELQKWNVSAENLPKELAAYLSTSFGDPTRIDYGTGHEAHFLVLLYCLDRVGVFAEDDDEQIVLLAFPAYLRVTRLLQRVYMLEPAGSHGVWGLDDFSFLPFVWGSSQLLSSSRILPDIILDDEGLRENRAEYLYIDAVACIKEIKKGPFHEHSRVLYDVSGVKEGWPKINTGMIKMYKGEVWAKRPVIQHCLFGNVFRYQEPEPKPESDTV